MQAKRRALAIDDDLATCAALQLALEELGYDAAVVDRPAVFWQEFQKGNWAAVLVDAVLPEGGRLAVEVGLSLARQVRQKEPAIPIMIFSAYKQEEEVIRACADQIGAKVEFKPLGLRRLEDALSRLLGGRNA